MELCHHLTPTAELRKRNFTKTFHLEKSCGSGTSQRHTTRAELGKWNFAKTYLQSRIVEVELRKDISSRVKLWNFPKTNPQSRAAELCKDVTK